MDEALPNCSAKYGRIASSTSGRTGVVALLSRYTRRMGLFYACQAARLPLPDGHVGGGVLGSDVVGTRADEPVVVQLLDDVRRPARDARHGEDGREQVHVDAQRGVGGSRVEVHVGVELLFFVDVEL